MSDNTAGVITIIVVVAGFFVLPNFIDAWQARGVAKYNAIEAQHRAEAAKLNGGQADSRE